MSGAEAELLCNLSGLLSYSRLEASILHLLPRGIKEKADGIQPRVRWVEIDKKGLIGKIIVPSTKLINTNSERSEL